MNRPKGLDVLIYLRKSRKDIEAEKKAIEDGVVFDTLDRHRKQLLDIAKKENHNIIKIYEEVATGENISERPEMLKMLRKVEEGTADGILAMDLDRLGRGDMFDSGLIYRALQFSETLLIFPSEVIDPNSEEAELIFGIKSLVSRQELKQITKRMQRGRKASASEGKSITNRIPFGYLRDENLRLYPNPDTAWVVTRIFEMFAAGMGRQQIANELDLLGVKTPTGGDHWNVGSISNILKNEVYYGRIVWGKIKHTKRAGKYQKKQLPVEQWHIKDNAHEPLVSKELFDKANLASSARWRVPTVETKTISNPMAGVLFCEVCGHSMLYQPRPDRPNDYIRCVYPGCKGTQKGATLKLVEERLLQGLEQIVKEFELQEKMIKQEESTSIIPFKEKSLNKKIQELEDLNIQKNNLHDLLEKGVYDINTFMERQKVLGDRINSITEAVDQLNMEIKHEAYTEKNKKTIIPNIKNALEHYNSTDDIAKKNRLLKTILEKATYRRDKDWKQKDQFVIQLYPRI